MKRLRQKNINTKEYWNKSQEFFQKKKKQSAGDMVYEIARNIDYGDDVLDVGAGSGMITRRLKKLRPNLKIYACDFALNAVKYLKTLKLNGVFICDINQEINRIYDTVICTEALEHLEDPKKVVDNLNKAARKKIIITVPYKTAIKSEEHLWEFDLDDTYNLLKDYGMVYQVVANGGSNIVAVCVKNTLKM